MAGIYTRDNLASIYASNLEKALARRDAYEKERQARVKSNVDAINKLIAAGGRTIDDKLAGSYGEQLAKLQKDYEEALGREAKEAEIANIYNAQVAQRQRFDNWANASDAQRHGWGYASAMNAVPQIDLAEYYRRRM